MSSATVLPNPKAEENAVITVAEYEYAFKKWNFNKIVKQWKMFDAQLKLFTEQFELFVDKKIKETITPYENLHGCIDDIER